ncbi:MAG: glutamate 5-kinase [Anaerolineae bacterium]
MSRIVVKLGTSVLTAGTPHLNRRRMLDLVGQVAGLCESGHGVVLVSSGAVAAGRALLDDPHLNRSVPARQMLSAIGQPRLMHIYADLFAIFEVHVAQVLLTRGDVTHRERYLNARDTLMSLLARAVVPIINENDTVSTAEIRVGDNDNLSAYVANLIDADLLVLLTDQPGLFTTDPRTDPNAQLIPVVDRIDEALFAAAGGSGSPLGTGGMRTKLEAAQFATRSGTTVVIAQGARPDVLLDLMGPDCRSIGTWFEPTSTHMESRKRWLLSESPHGSLHVDAGAVRALREHKVSLLPVGITAVHGAFDRGVVVGILGPDGAAVARGLATYSSAELDRIRGVQSERIVDRLGYTLGNEAVHRDYLVVMV